MEAGGHEVLAIRKMHPSRDAIEGFISAIILVLIVRHFVFEVFKIPTGSMAPTLLGSHVDLKCPNCGYEYPVDANRPEGWRSRCPNCAYLFSALDLRDAKCRCFGNYLLGSGNRVVVDKFLGKFEKSQRWGVTVFRYPGIEELTLFGHTFRYHPNFIKRLIGFPGENVKVLHGDIYINDKLAPKPRNVQESLWQFVYDSRFVPKEKLQTQWMADDGAMAMSGPVLELTPDSNRPVTATFVPDIIGIETSKKPFDIIDYAPYNGYPPLNYSPVGDLRWKTRVQTEGPGAVRLIIQEEDDKYVAEIAFGNGGHTGISDGSQIIAESDFSADPAAAHDISFANWDDNLLLTVDGKDVVQAVHHVEPDIDSKSSSAALAVVGTKAKFEYVHLDRDIFYQHLPGDYRGYDCENGYFFLGDNSGNSRDSRMWGSASVDSLVGPAVVVWWPLGTMHAIP